MSLIGGIDVPGEAPPEVPNGHGVVVQHPVVPDPPEPPALVGNGVLTEDRGMPGHSPSARHLARVSSHPGTHHIPREGAGRGPSWYLEHKHLPTQHRHCVEVPITDVGAILVRSVWAARFGGPLRFPWGGRFRGSLVWPARSPGCHGGQRLGGLRVPVRGTWIGWVREGMG